MNDRNPSVPAASEGAAYEVARDILAELVAISTARLDNTAGGTAGADTESWQERRDEWLTQLEGLRPGDGSAVSAVLQSLGPLLTRLRAAAP